MNLGGHGMKTGLLKTGIAGRGRKSDICDHMKKSCDHSLRKRGRTPWLHALIARGLWLN
jgi:hypothetical protein